MDNIKLKIIPHFAGLTTLKNALEDKRGQKLLWLEILLNGDINWEDYCDIPEINTAYEKACIWYTNFRSMIDAYVKRPPLRVMKGRVDDREYRRLIEVLNFVRH